MFFSMKPGVPISTVFSGQAADQEEVSHSQGQLSMQQGWMRVWLMWTVCVFL